MEKIDRQLIAPCGMYCAICSSYLAFKNNLPKVKGKIYHCQGCRPRNKKCAFIIKRCEYSRDIIKGDIEFCFQCGCCPCDSLNKLDSRYRKNYGMSMIENLKVIEEKGIPIFLENQRKKYQCPKCDGLKSIHNKKCYACDTIISWKK